MKPGSSPYWHLLLIVVISAMVCVLAWLMGSQSIDWAEVWRAGSTSHTILFELRLPRVLAGFFSGGLLALSGALLQVLLRNPLADPGVLGVSGGASLGALSAIALGVPLAWVSAGAAVGALLSTALLFLFSARSLLSTLQDSQASVRVLLTGVMLGSASAAGVSVILSLAPETDLRGMLFWLLGDLSGAQYLSLAGVTWLLAGIVGWLLSPALNLLLLGDIQALMLGVHVKRLRWGVLLLCALSTGVAVTVAGAIGFVGLIVPHLLRRWLGHDQRLLLPACWLGGGALLVLADALARTCFSPLQLPVGVMTALLGVPVFLWILSHARR
ncbi:MAG: iron ABC transporter permease [Burkholderiales bacterium]|nr:iron ABC transporter permease [Burkholderiales bacterium]MCA3162550.1 iron ABC transporter permease [Burkholderiales bacterium]MCA3163327.1 iron ABC transporter permease [Burkholderiales bacterium]MCA3166663.1 iron ABC transporter permease [Burkholderiales bacterium]MCA3170171.1 iron ABC transporter permease [Burkholderiales bacterium]